MQQPQESAAEAEAQRRRAFGLVMEAGIVQRQLAQAVAQMLVIGGIDREQATEHDRDGRLEAGQHLGRRAAFLGQRVADAAVRHGLDAGRDIAQLTRPEGGNLDALRVEHADTVHRMRGAGRHHADLGAMLQRAIDDAHQDDDAEIGVVPAVQQQGAQGGGGVGLDRGRQAVDDGFQHVVDSDTGLGGNRDGVRGVQPDHILDLLLHAVDIGGRQIDLVQHRHDLVIGVQRQIDIGQRLRLDTLAGIDQQQRALAGRQRTADLIGEINMARRIDQVQQIFLPVLGDIGQAYGLRLDGDAALALDIHRVEQLLLHLARLHRAAALDQPVGKGGFAVVDMRHDGEVADVFLRDRHVYRNAFLIQNSCHRPVCLKAGPAARKICGFTLASTVIPGPKLHGVPEIQASAHSTSIQ